MAKSIQAKPGTRRGCSGQFRWMKGKASIKVDKNMLIEPGTRGGMPEIIQKGAKKKGGYES